MEPLNIIRSNTEQKQNSVAPIIFPRQSAYHIDWRIVVIIVITLGAVWAIASIVAGYYCSYGSLCLAQSLVFWSIPTVLFLVFSGVALWGAFYGIMYARTAVQKSRFANSFTHHFDVWQTAMNESMQRYIIDKVAHEVSKSLATAEVDTLTISPHTETSSTNVQTDKEDVSPDLPIDKDKSILETLHDTGKIGRSGNSLAVGFTKDE